MKVYIAIILSVISLCAAHLKYSHENSHEYTFSDYELEFNKKYADEQEHLIRREIFESNFEKIKKINADPSKTWKAGVNFLTDRMNKEIDSLKGLNRSLRFKTHRPNFSAGPSQDEINDLPDSVDWRTKGVVSNVRNQGGCGSCWAFATIATLESHVAIQTGKLLAMSEQQLVDCVQNPQHCGGTGGCEGATEELGFDYVHKAGGIIARDNYKYTAVDGTCKDTKNPKIASIEGFTQLKTNDYDALMVALANQGPVSISVAASAWSFYSSGIFSQNCGTDINHAVVAVGYGVEKGKKFWIVRNSWGTGWGENGYIRIMRENSAKDVKCAVDYNPADGSGCDGGPSQITVCGECGMYADSSMPFGGKLV